MLFVKLLLYSLFNPLTANYFERWKKVLALLQMVDKKSYSPEFKIQKGDAIRESLVFFISKEFDLIRDDLENKFDRVDAVGHSKQHQDFSNAKVQGLGKV